MRFRSAPALISSTISTFSALGDQFHVDERFYRNDGKPFAGDGLIERFFHLRARSVRRSVPIGRRSEWRLPVPVGK